MKDNEVVVAYFRSIKDLAKFFNTNPNVMSSSICKKALKENRYKIEKIKMEKE